MDKNKNQALMVKIICVLLSFSLWLYITNVENPVRTYDVKKVPVELTNLDYVDNSKLSVMDGQNFTVDIKIEGAWADVNKVKAADFKLVADMSTYALKEGENIIPVQIVDYPENITIKSNGILSIKVNLEAITSKELKLSSNVKINYKPGIHEVSQMIDPDTVEVKGGRSIVDKINSAAIEGELTDITKDTTKSFDIVFLDEDGNEINNVKSNIETAELSIAVTNGKSVPINFSIVGTPKDGYELESYESNITMVGIIGNEDILANISKIETENIDISSLVSDTELNVKLVIPDGVSVENQQNTIKVKIKIKKKENLVTEETKANKVISCIVKYDGLSDNLSMDSSTKEVNISLSGLKGELDKITSSNASVTVDLSQINKDGTYNLKPIVSLENNQNITIDSVDNVNVQISNKE